MKRRSSLYVPGDNERMVAKSWKINADALIFDLEDSVRPENKNLARSVISKTLKNSENSSKEIQVRINPVISKEFKRDMKFVKGLQEKVCVVVPKSEYPLPEELVKSDLQLIPLIETAAGLLHVESLCRYDSVTAVSWGAADLSLSMGGQVEQYENNGYVYMALVSAARAYGIDPIDKVYFNLDNLAGFESECNVSHGLGYVGKQLIHPSQVDIANRIFTPSERDIKWAREIIAALESTNRGAIRSQGKLIDSVHVRIAKRILESAET
ncbi:MAG: CoA ester lyase [Candidatus Thermoplasmatota archaeon]|nr:CoA ester lyase [Candidatus Thermoplasmatota archaeon]